MDLFDKLPGNFFSVLSRKYKAVYAYSLLSLFDTLKKYKTKIKKSDYFSELRSHGETLINLFDVDLDKMDDKPEEEEIPYTLDESVLSSKINYIFRRLVSDGWVDVERDLETNTDYLYLPSYSIKMIELLSDLVSDASLYIPLVHQTYSELSLEDEKEDDYMFRSLLSARKNSDELELNVTLLHHSICVFGHNLTSVFDPNEVLRQHFDLYKSEIGDKVYHPMKTYDSLGLYSLPCIAILKKWQHDSRVMGKLTSQAKFDPEFMKLKSSEAENKVNQMIQETIDIFSRLNDSFTDIDKANAKYTKAVQKKVNFLSSGDKTIKGKLDAIILRMAKDIDKAPSFSEARLNDIKIVNEASQTIMASRQCFVDSDSLTMPFKREARANEEPLPLEEAFYGDDSDFSSFLQEENRFSQEAVEAFMEEAFGNKRVITTDDIAIPDMDHLVLLILATVRSEFGNEFFTIEKIGEQMKEGNFLLPKYRFTKKGKDSKNV